MLLMHFLEFIDSKINELNYKTFVFLFFCNLKIAIFIKNHVLMLVLNISILLILHLI
jgi:hypothetical protein